MYRGLLLRKGWRDSSLLINQLLDCRGIHSSRAVWNRLQKRKGGKNAKKGGDILKGNSRDKKEGHMHLIPEDFPFNELPPKMQEMFKSGYEPKVSPEMQRWADDFARKWHEGNGSKMDLPEMPVESEKSKKRSKMGMDVEVSDMSLSPKEFLKAQAVGFNKFDKKFSGEAIDMSKIVSHNPYAQTVTDGSTSSTVLFGRKRLTAMEKIKRRENNEKEKSSYFKEFVRTLGYGKDVVKNLLSPSSAMKKDISSVVNSLPDMLRAVSEKTTEHIRPTRLSPNANRVINIAKNRNRRWMKRTNLDIENMKEELGIESKREKKNSSKNKWGEDGGPYEHCSSSDNEKILEAEVMNEDNEGSGRPIRQRKKKKLFADISRSDFDNAYGKEPSIKDSTENPGINVSGLFYQDGKAMTLDEIIEMKQKQEDKKREEAEKLKAFEESSLNGTSGGEEEEEKLQGKRKRSPRKFSMELTPLQAAFRKNNQMVASFENDDPNETRKRKGKLPYKAGKYPQLKTRTLLGAEFDQLTNKAKNVLASKVSE